jgi:hypothetical protein
MATSTTYGNNDYMSGANYAPFNKALNQYLPYELLKNEQIKRSYVLNVIKENGNLDEQWLGGELIVPFVGSSSSSIAWGALPAADDIAKRSVVRGKVTGYKELNGAMRFDHKDLFTFDGKFKEQSFLGSLLDEIPDFMETMKEKVAQNLLGGAHIDVANITNSTIVPYASVASLALQNGYVGVSRPERFDLGMKVQIRKASAATITDAYVYKIYVDSSCIQLVTTRNYPDDGVGITYVDLSDVAEYPASFKFYHPGGISTANVEYAYDNLRTQLLSAANGGSATIYGVTKLNYRYTQSLNFTGAAMTRTSILDDIFTRYVSVNRQVKNGPSEVWLSYTNFGYCMQILELEKGAYNQADKVKVNKFGWKEININGIDASLKLVAINEMDDDIILLMNPASISFHTNKWFQRHQDPNGNQFFTVRDATNGFYYIVDMFMYGNFICHAPSKNAIIHSIPVL